MSDKITFRGYASGLSAYVEIWDASGEVADVVGEAMAAYATADRANYALTAGELDPPSLRYQFTVPAWLAPGRYAWSAYAGATPATSDPEIRTGGFQWDGSALIYDGDVYHADINFSRDNANSRDEYTAAWFKNGVRVTSGITSPTIQAIKRADGTDLVAAAAMTQIGATGSYKYDEATNRAGLGEAVVIVVSATIDGATHSFARVASRDS